MKIKDLGLIEQELEHKLRDILDMDVDDFIHIVDAKKKNGDKINKPYIRLYNYIKENNSLCSSSNGQIDALDHETEVRLKRIPIDYLKYYYDDYLISKLKNGNCTNLLDIYGIKDRDLRQIPYVGSAMFDKLKKIKDAVKSNPHYYIDKWEEYNTINSLPSNYDRSFGLSVNLTNALIEYAQIIRKNLSNNMYIRNSQQKKSYTLLANILTKTYKQHIPAKSIAEEEGCMPQHIDQIRYNCLSEILKGEVFFNNYRLNQDLIDLMESLGSECLFTPIHQYYEYSGSNDLSMLKALGYDTITIKDVEILIPVGTKGICYTVWRAIQKVLCDNPLPTDKNVIEQQILEHNDLADIEYDTRLIDFVLSSDYFVENKGNNLIQIKDEYLTSNPQRMARIIYEAGNKLTREQVFDKFEELYKFNQTDNISIARKYGISCQGKKYWYYGQPITPLQQWVTDFAEEKVIFFYSELEQEMKKAGYTIPKAVRAYITNICSVDNKDPNHFCLKDCVDQYTDFRWRASTTYGWANWVYNEIKNILAEKGTLSVSKMIDTLEKRSQQTEYKKIRQRLQYNNMADYCGVDKPFIVTNGNVDINKSVFDKTDFELVGLRGIKNPYFRQIRSLVANELKKVDSKSKRITEIVKIVQDTIDETINRNSIIRALKDEQERFASKDFDVVNEGGILIVKLLKKEADVEPVYVASAKHDDTDTIQLVEEQKTDKRPSIKYRQQIDYDKLNSMLKRELAFYDRWMQVDNIKMGTAIDLFIDFIRQAKNDNIREHLPQDLYEYWFASTDSYDRYKYFTDLTIMFEGLLKEIYIRNNAKEPPHTTGLMQLVGAFPGLPLLLLRSRDSKGFNRIGSDLVFKRNKVAHGEYVEMSSSETALTITEFVALYVYIVAKYTNS